MKNLIEKLRKIDKLALCNFFDFTIEHKLFKPIVILILVSFVLITGFDYVQNVIDDYRDYSLRKSQSTPIKINISTSAINFDLDEEQILDHTVKQGDTITKILFDLGVPENDVFAILGAMKKVFNPKDIIKGNQISIKYKVKIGYNGQDKINNAADKVFGKTVIVNNLSLSSTPEQEIVVTRKNDGNYDAREIKVNLQRYVSRYYGTLKNGFYLDGVEAGISPTAMMNMIQLYSYDIDFQRDIHNGDKFEMLVESFYNEDGKKIKDGNVLFSSLTLQKNRSINFYLHKIDGKIEYFDEKGNSVRKSLLRTPINGARVSSGFGMRRHPILGYSKMHKGIDFAAMQGTPILAAGSGVITYFAPKGGYGNFVQIKHNSDYSTAYGHASRYAARLHVGSKVKQGQVVAYVGSTGRSTGPHLHFEIIYKGQQINPAKVKATSGLKLVGKELMRFEADKAEINKYRQNIPNQIKR
ncbi:MAG: peptidoglycan DD-metalloendopeptidase family protein [Rickettsiales bacterium]|nr:peptidoglycan DD-metalloendopeptidase family protein [Rickettsiales bacterium]